jgi:exodeoxyribonuclease VII small subunit
MAKNKDKLSLEEKINRIQEIVETLDSSEKPLEEMIKIYEEGMKLANECRVFLENAESKIVDITNKYSSTVLIAKEDNDESFDDE